MGFKLKPNNNNSPGSFPKKQTEQLNTLNQVAGNGIKPLSNNNDNDNPPPWYKSSSLTDAKGNPVEVVVTGSQGTISGKRAGDFVKGPTRASDPNNPVQLKKGESISFTGVNRSTGNKRTTTYTPKEDTTKTRIPGRSFADADTYYTTKTPVRITQTELKPLKKK